ncbi:MAG: zinc ribbon domain-containing protein [Pseudodesulfovibrio sp.]
MPIYEYQCHDCQSVFEEWQSGFEEKEMECPDCGKSAKRLISHTSFHLKGSGWYVTDYAGKKSSDSDTSDSGNGDGDAKDAKTESGGCDSGCPKKGGQEAAPVATKKETTDTPSAGSAS